MNLALDFGNSLLKVAVFNQRKLLFVSSQTSLPQKKLESIIRRFQIDASILSSVVEDDKKILQLLKKKTHFIKLNSSTRLPIKNYYRTPATLGSDRLANLMGAIAFFPQKNVLVISAGTCITYDVITSQKKYFGGNITPGLDMRLKAMNTFTARLPLVKKTMTKELVGKSTETSMLSGAVIGAALEMRGFISGYRKKHPSLKIVLTGGDAPYFETMINQKIPAGKSETFAIPHLLLYGLNEILLTNNE